MIRNPSVSLYHFAKPLTSLAATVTWSRKRGATPWLVRRAGRSG